MKHNLQLRDVILGGQDGLVNVLGLSLGLYAAHTSSHIILIAGLAAGFSESVSMGSVEYTSELADKNRDKKESLLYRSIIVGFSALLGSVMPIFPFFFLDSRTSIYISIIICTVILFGLGISKARTIGGNIWKSGLQIVLIGLVSAFAGFLIGYLLQY